MEYLEYKGKHLALVAVITCTLSGLYVAGNAANASSYRLPYDTRPTKKIRVGETTKWYTQHELVINKVRIIPTLVVVVCDTPVHARITNYGAEQIFSQKKLEWSDTEYSFLGVFYPSEGGGFHPDMIVEIRDPIDPKKDYVGEDWCAVWWYYTL